MKRARILLSLLVFLLLVTVAVAQSGYSLFGRVVGGGGRSTGKPYTLIGAVGQPEAGTELSGGEYRLSGGGPSAAIPSESRCKPAPAQAGITAATNLPPDPGKVASEVDQTVVTDIYYTTMFLYTGSTPIQLEMTPDAIDPALVAVLRGKVLTRDNAPLAGVLITILDHPEYGCTFSREDGMFDLVVNGGSQLTVNYEKTGYPPAQRPVTLKYLVILVVIAVCLCGQAFGAVSDLIADAKFVKDKIGKPGWVLVDMRVAEDYSQGHIPGAVNLPAWVSKAFADDTNRQTESLAKMEQTLGEMGIGNDSHIIVYGEPKHASWNAVMFWAMELFGCNSDSMKCTVRFYDEGVNGWKEDGGTLDRTPPAVKPATFKTIATSKRGAKADEVVRIAEGGKGGYC